MHDYIFSHLSRLALGGLYSTHGLWPSPIPKSHSSQTCTHAQFLHVAIPARCEKSLRNHAEVAHRPLITQVHDNFAQSNFPVNIFAIRVLRLPLSNALSITRRSQIIKDSLGTVGPWSRSILS